MFSADLGGAAPASTPAATDPPFQKVALLLNGDGTNGAQNNTFVDYSYPGGYAVSFDGTGDYLSTSSITLSGDFTIETWVYSSRVSPFQPLIQIGADNTSTGPLLYINTSQQLVLFVSGSALVSSTLTIPLNTWTHVACVRSGSTLKLYINGINSGTATNTTTFSGNTLLGAEYFGYVSAWMQGYLSNSRIATTALYTSNFTPSNLPLTAVSGTSLLTCQSATIVDNSPNAFTITANGDAAAVASKTITRTGNVAQGTFSPFSLPEGQWSNYFDGNTDYLTFDGSSSTAFGTGQYTVEGWFYLTDISGTKQIFDCRPTGTGVPWGCEFQTGAPSWYNGASRTSSTAITANTWNHVAFVREGTGTNQAKIYINGSVVHTFTDNVNYGTMNTASRIGYNISNVNSFAGYMSNLRIVKGSAVYTSNFTPSTTPLTAITNTSLLTCQSNRFKDNSSNNFALTVNGDTKVTAFSPLAPSAAYSASTNGGSGYFDGSGDYLTAPTGTAFAFGTGSFTVEAWINIPSNPSGSSPNSYYVIYDNLNVSGHGGRYSSFVWLIQSSGVMNVFSDSSFKGASTSTVPLNQWVHLALVRNGSSSVTYYINGISAGTITLSTNLTTGGCVIGALGDNTADGIFKGYISNIRIVKGTAVYTANFTPPTAPLTAVTNTQLLLNCTNAGIIDNSGKNDIETVGNAQISTSVKKYGTGSMYFDGTGDYLVNQGNADLFAFGSGDFTIEMWLYSPTSQTKIIYDSRPSSTQGTYPVIYQDSSNIKYYANSADRITSSLTLNTWNHIAVCRSGTSTKMFINGTQVGSTYSDSTVYLNPASRPLIASSGYTPNSDTFNGYIDDLRITKGQALYTSNFTPPTQAFPNV